MPRTDPQGRVAVELYETSLGRRPLETPLAAHKRKSTITAVLFLVRDHRIGVTVRRAAARLDMSGPVRVQPFRWAR